MQSNMICQVGNSPKNSSHSYREYRQSYYEGYCISHIFFLSCKVMYRAQRWEHHCFRARSVKSHVFLQIFNYAYVAFSRNYFSGTDFLPLTSNKNNLNLTSMFPTGWTSVFIMALLSNRAMTTTRL